MSVSEHERHQLFTWFEEQLGSERAATMMSLLRLTGWGDVAARRDLELLEARIDARLDQFETRLDAKLEQLRAEHATLPSSKRPDRTGRAHRAARA